MEATEKQKDYMDKLGLDYDENISKKEAISLIDNALKGKETKAETYNKQIADKFKKPQDTSSYYVAYAKDLCIVLVNTAMEREKMLMLEDRNEIEVDKLMELSIHCIEMAQKAFR